MYNEDIRFLYKLTKNGKAYKLSDKLSGELLGYVDENGLLIVNEDFNTISTKDMEKILKLRDAIYNMNK